MKARRMLGLGAGTAAALLLAAPAISAQENFSFAGTWIGEFEEKTEPEFDMASRDDPSGGRSTGRSRAIAGEGKFECEGSWTLTFQGANEDLSGSGAVEQTCKAMREGTWQVPSNPLVLQDIEFKDKGEGKDKELKFSLRMTDVKSGDSATIRCESKGKYKPKDMVFEGDYSCRHELRQRQSNQRVMAYRVRGKFKLTRGGMSTGQD